MGHLGAKLAPSWGQDGLKLGQVGAMLAKKSIMLPLFGKFAKKVKISKKCYTIVDFGGFGRFKLGLCWAMLGLCWAKLEHLGCIFSHLKLHVG